MNSSMMLIETTSCILGSGKKNKRKDATTHSETESAHPKKTKLTSPSTKSEEGDADDSSSISSDSDDGKEQEKVLKQLNFPDVENGSFNPNMCPKVMKCLSKRLSKLETHESSFPEESKRSEVQSQSESQKSFHFFHVLLVSVCISLFPVCLKASLRPHPRFTPYKVAAEDQGPHCGLHQNPGQGSEQLHKRSCGRVWQAVPSLQ